MGRYYFAYGSNLNLKQMFGIRCHEAKKIGATILKDYELVFKKFLDVVPKKNSQVPIGIFTISPSDEKKLDDYEGVSGNYYYKKEITLPFNNQMITGLIYIMVENNKYRKLPSYYPTDKYIETCRQGYKDFGFDQKYLDIALNNAKKNN